MMSIDQNDIQSYMKALILREFLGGEEESNLDNSTSLVTGGILDSIGLMRLVMDLEHKFEVQIDSSEVTINNMDTISSIAALVLRKVGDN